MTNFKNSKQDGNSHSNDEASNSTHNPKKISSSIMINPHLQGASRLVENARQLENDGERCESSYKAELHRELNWWSIFCIAFGQVALLPNIASVIFYGLHYGGTAGMFWGGLLVMIPLQCISLCLAELCSSMPTSGGTYYVAAALAPEGYGPILSWISGWSNWIAQVTSVSAFDHALSSMILAAISISNPHYHPKPLHKFILSSTLMIFHATLASLPTKRISFVNTYSTLLNLLSLGFFCLFIPLWKTHGLKNSDLLLTPSTTLTHGNLTHLQTSSLHSVLTTFRNPTDYPDWISVAMSSIGIIWLLIGFDTGFNLSDECADPRRSCPRAIVLSSSLTLGFGWIIQLLVALTILNIEPILSSTLDQTWASYLLEQFPKKITLVLLSLTISCGISVGQASIVSASRITYAYARDDFFSSLSPTLKKLHPKLHVPINAIWFNTFLGIGFLLFTFAGKTAINAFFSLGSMAALVSYLIPIANRTFSPKRSQFIPGPWSLGKASRPMGFMSVAFILFMLPIISLPDRIGRRLTIVNMNWTSVVYGTCITVVMIWWFVSARKWFKGPKILEFDYHGSERCNISFTAAQRLDTESTVVQG